ncbi:MAG: DUF2283 domain-containing protein [Dehalococcoidia bacterium]|nr:DUF2283 domain-containing protein [Dehalococcoidia bacterium]
MKITYDPEADALYIELRKAEASNSIDVEEGVVVDLDGDGHVIGIEVLDASVRLTDDELKKLSYENLVLGKKAALSLP